MKIARKAYPTYFRNGYNFRQSIQNPDSQLRKVIDILSRDYAIDRFTFYMESRVHSDGDFSAMKIVDGTLRVRPGYGASFWTALRSADVIRNSGLKTDMGYSIYYPGHMFPTYQKMARFFTKSSKEVRFHYGHSENVPDGWEIVSY